MLQLLQLILMSAWKLKWPLHDKNKLFRFDMLNDAKRPAVITFRHFGENERVYQTNIG